MRSMRWLPMGCAAPTVPADGATPTIPTNTAPPTVPANSGRVRTSRERRRAWPCSGGSWACAVASAVLAACEGPLVPPLPADDVYEYRLAVDPPRSLRWPVGAVIRVHVVEGGGDPDALRAAVAAGADEWNRHALLDEYRVAPTASALDANVLVAWSTATMPVETSPCPPQGGRAQTTFCLDGQRLFTYPMSNGQTGAVKMLVTIGTVLAGATPAELQAVVAHELGHVLGIARHSSISSDLMYTDPARTTLSQRDVATVRALYRAPVDIVP